MFKKNKLRYRQTILMFSYKIYIKYTHFFTSMSSTSSRHGIPSTPFSARRTN